MTMVACALCAATAAADPPAGGANLGEGDAAFAARLYGQLRGGRGNLFFSPASVRLALAMAYAGARGPTATEMQHALALPAGDAAHDGFAALLGHFAELGRASEGHQRSVLRVVNRLWAQSGYHFLPPFVARLRDSYRAPLAELDFHKDPEAGRAAINRWVSEQTEKKIPELLARGLVERETRMVLTNAVYFKAQWSEPFYTTNTAPEPFFVDGKKPANAPMMHRTDHMRVGAIDSGQILELPYGDGELVMDVVLPAKKDGLPALEAQFAAGALPRWLGRLAGGTRVQLTLPRFRSSASFSLGEALSALGMPTAFRFPGADFSGMDGGRDLYIGVVVHQAMVDVDENGTEAAAATAVLMKAGAAMPADKPVVFRADHPFLYVIRDPVADVILFAGRLVDPR